jgi:hypothetical protein
MLSGPSNTKISSKAAIVNARTSSAASCCSAARVSGRKGASSAWCLERRYHPRAIEVSISANAPVPPLGVERLLRQELSNLRRQSAPHRLSPQLSDASRRARKMTPCERVSLNDRRARL